MRHYANRPTCPLWPLHRGPNFTLRDHLALKHYQVPWPRGGRGRRLGHGETQEQDPEGFLLQPRWSDAGILSWLPSPLGWEQGPPQRRLWGRPVSNVWYSLKIFTLGGSTLLQAENMYNLFSLSIWLVI